MFAPSEPLPAPVTHDAHPVAAVTWCEWWVGGCLAEQVHSGLCAKHLRIVQARREARRVPPRMWL